MSWDPLIGGNVETYILMAICLVTFVGTVVGFRFLLEDPEMGMIFGAVAGLILSIAAGGAYYMHLAACNTCM